MKKLKWTIVLLTLVLMFAATGCAPENDSPSATILRIMIPGERPKNMDAVIAEAERRMKDSLNVKLDVQFVPFPEIAQKSRVALTTGQQVDLIFDAPWLHLSQMAGTGAYEPLDDLLSQYGPDILAARPKEMWDANRIGGSIVAIPLGAYQSGTPSNNHTYLVRKDIREKFGIPPIRSYEELVRFEYEVRDKVPGMVPFSTNTAGDTGEASMRFRFHYGPYIRSTPALGQSVVLYYKNNDGRVYNLFDRMEPVFWQYVLHARKLYLDGIIDPDIMTVKDEYRLLRTGRQAVGTSNDFGVPRELQAELERHVPGAALEAVTFYDFTKGKNISNFVQGNFIAVPAASKNKELAIRFLNWANRKENYELLAYGIKGTDWEEAGEGLYRPIGDGYAWFPYAWIWNPAHDLQNAGQSRETIEANRFIMNSSNFTADKLAGFSFDSAPVANELSQYQILQDRYYSVLMNGAADPATLWQAFKSEAGHYVKLIQAELQRQIDVFLDEERENHY